MNNIMPISPSMVEKSLESIARFVSFKLKDLLELNLQLEVFCVSRRADKAVRKG